MGMDFSAIFTYRGLKRCSQQIAALERQVPPQFDVVLTEWKTAGFFNFAEDYRYTAWIHNESNRQVKRPKNSPQLDVCLRTPQGFFITFGKDAFVVYHLLRWRFFMTEPQWQSAMLNACAALAQLFDSDQCVLAHDCHPLMTSFRDDLNFEACVASVAPTDGEVLSIADLYFEIDEPCDLVIQTEAGWATPTIWDSKGFWRFPWREHVT